MVDPDQVIRKIGWRLLPLLMLLFFFNFLDRVNIGFAALEMNKSIGLSPVVFGWGAGAFFLSYAICQIPSSLLLNRLRIRLWIVSIAVVWGTASAGMAFATGPKSFIALRFLLGIAEAGFFPGFIYYLGFWFPKAARARFNALFLVAVPLATMLGNPLSGLIVGAGDIFGISAWRWLFVIEGFPSVVLGIIAFYWLSDSPAQANWLTSEEREWLVRTIQAEQGNTVAVGNDTLWNSLTDLRVLVLSTVSFFFILAIYGIGMWLPQIVSGFGASHFETGLLSAIPYAASVIGMLFWSARSDARAERRKHISIAAIFSGASLLAASQLSSPGLSLLAISIAAVCIFSASAVFWTLPTSFLTGGSAAAAIGMINSVGNLGGFAGPYLVGWIKTATGSFNPALITLGLTTVTGGILMFFAPSIVRRSKVQNLKMQALE